MRTAFLHGFAGDPDAWTEVVSVLATMAPSIVPVVPALPGHGVPIGRDWADNLDRVAAAIAGAPAVVGYSLGARVALGLLATDRVERAVLIGVNPGIAEANERAARAAADEVWAARLVDPDGFFDAWEQQPLFGSQARVDPARLAARRARRRRLDPDGLAASLRTMGLAAMPDYRAALRARAERAHLIVGADDAKFVAIARDLVGECPGLAMDCVTGSGHDLTLEQPGALAGDVARALGRWWPHVLSSE